MNPVLLVPLITVFGPAVVNGVKKLLGTEEKKLIAEMDDDLKTVEQVKIVHKALPLLVGVAASILACLADCEGPGCFERYSIEQCIMAGLAGGAGAAYIRDFDKNILGIGDSAMRLFRRR